MKHLKLVIVFFAGAALAGCGKSSTNTAPSANQSPVVSPTVAASPPAMTASPSVAGPTPPSVNRAPAAPPQLAQVNQDLKQTAEDLKDYTYAQKGGFVQKIMTARNDLHQQLIQLSAKIDRASDAVKAEAQPKLDVLRTQLAQLDTVMDKAMIASESTWDQVKSETQTAYEKTKLGIQDASQWIDSQVNS